MRGHVFKTTSERTSVGHYKVLGEKKCAELEHVGLKDHQKIFGNWKYCRWAECIVLSAKFEIDDLNKSRQSTNKEKRNSDNDDYVP
eukprot:UN00905